MPPDHRFFRKSRHKNRLKRRRNPCCIFYQQKQTATQVQHAHHRNQAGTNLRRFFRSSDQDAARQKRRCDANPVYRHRKPARNYRCQGMRLHTASDAQRRQHGKDGKKNRQQPIVQQLLHHIHRSAIKASVCPLFPARCGQHAFRIAGRHPEKAADPAPENRPGSSERNCTRNSDDISGSDCRRQGG